MTYVQCDAVGVPPARMRLPSFHKVVPLSCIRPGSLLATSVCVTTLSLGHRG